MPHLHSLALAMAGSALLGLVALPAAAGDGFSEQIREARQEGSIWTAFAFNHHLGAFSLNVDVEHGLATLTGTVANEVNRELAEQVALGVEGIDAVDNLIRVDPGVRPRLLSIAAADSHLDDATVTGKVKTRFLSSDNLAALDISVETDDGVVRLAGNVATAAEKALAVETARNVRGVLDVHAASLKVAG